MARRKHKRQRQKTRVELEKAVRGPDVIATAERAQHDELADEIIERSLQGRALTSRQIVSSPVRKLLEAGEIDQAEAMAAAMLRQAHEEAYSTSSCSLAGFEKDRVDGAGGNITQAMVDRVDAGLARSRALRYLGEELAHVAKSLVIEMASPIGNSYRSVGASFIGASQAPEQSGAGKGLLVAVCRKLAVYYGLKRSQWSS